MKIGIIGAGNVGITSAFAIAEKGSGKILLYDPVEGRAKGKALDLVEAGPIRRYDAKIHGTDVFEKLLDSQIVVIAAGKARSAEMRRQDLFEENLKIIEDLADKLKAGYADRTPPIVFVLSEPVDLMTLAFLKRTGWPKERVMGVGGILSASRMRHYVARELGIQPSDVDAMVMGAHGDHMAVMERYSRISGLPLEHLMTREQIDAVIDRTVHAGDEIVDQAKVGSSFFTPGAAVGALVESVTRDSDRVLSVSAYLDGEYGVSGLCASVPARLGREGIVRIFELPLTDGERERFHGSVDTLKPFLSRMK